MNAPLISEEVIEHLPIGIYRLDKDDTIISVNPTWLEIHGFSETADVEGRQIQYFFSNAGDADEFRRKLLAEKMVSDAVYQLNRSNGERFFAAIYSRALFDENGSYIGREGAVIDVTESEVSHKIMIDLPVGYYIVRCQDNEERIVYCNEQFAQMYEFSSVNAAIGYEIKELYKNIGDYEVFVRLMKTSKDNFVIRDLIQAKSIKGKGFVVESSAHWTKDRTGKIISRSGVMRDFTKDKALRILQKDIGLVLHTYSSNLIGIRHSIESVMETLGPDPFIEGRSPTLAEKESALRDLVAELILSLRSMINLIEERDPEISDRVRFRQMYHILLELENIIPALRFFNLQKIAKTIAEDCDKLLNNRILPRQTLKKTRGVALDIDRIISLAVLHDRDRDLVEIDQEVHNLRESITESLHEEISFGIANFWDIVNRAIENSSQFASYSNVSIRAKIWTKNPTIWCSERNMIRAIGNLLHNAIKYSWQDKSGTYIRIELREIDDWLELQIENYGVPIPEDELESGLIFQFGYRSRISNDRARVGTGIGLADTKDVVENHDGTLEVTSVPAVGYIQLDREIQPYITTVYVKLQRFNE